MSLTICIQGVTRSTADGEDPVRAAALVPQHLDIVPDAVAHGFQDRPVQIGSRVAQSESEDHATGVGIMHRGPLTGEVRQHQEPRSPGQTEEAGSQVGRLPSAFGSKSLTPECHETNG